MDAPQEPELVASPAGVRLALHRGALFAVGVLWVRAIGVASSYRPYDDRRFELQTAASVLLACIVAAGLVRWRRRLVPEATSFWWSGAMIVALAVCAVGVLLRAASARHVAPLLAEALVAAAIGASLTLIERAGLQRAHRLRARAAVAVILGLGATLGFLASTLQVAFTQAALTRASLEAGYTAVGRHLSADLLEVLLVATPWTAVLVACAWGRLCHAPLGPQLLTALSLSWVGPLLIVTCFDTLPPGPSLFWALAGVWALAGAVPVGVLLLLLRGLEVLELRLLGVPPVEATPWPAGSRRRLVTVVVVVALALTSAHAGLTLRFAGLREVALTSLRSRGEPLCVADLAPVDPQDDVWGRYERAVAAYEPGPPELDRQPWREPPGSRRRPAMGPVDTASADAHDRSLAQTDVWLARNARALELVVEASRRPRGRTAPRDAWLWTFGDPALERLHEAAIHRALHGGDVERAVEHIEVQRALLAALEPEVWSVLQHRPDPVVASIAAVLQHGEPSADSCRRMLVLLQETPGTLRRAERAERVRILERREQPIRAGPLGARLGWVRDRDLVAALAHLESTAELAELPASTKTADEPSRSWRPLTAAAVDFTRTVPRRWATWTWWREGLSIALRLRLQRLETGAYPVTLDLREPGTPWGFVYRQDLSGGCTLWHTSGTIHIAVRR